MKSHELVFHVRVLHVERTNCHVRFSVIAWVKSLTGNRLNGDLKRDEDDALNFNEIDVPDERLTRLKKSEDLLYLAHHRVFPLIRSINARNAYESHVEHIENAATVVREVSNRG